MIPVHVDCPYNEVIYDADQHVLAVIGKECKESFQLVPKMTEKGDPSYLPKPRMNGKNYAEERRVLDTWYEYYIETYEDMCAFIEYFAVNEGFDYKQYIKQKQAIEPPVNI
jgi:hypothetical protein